MSKTLLVDFSNFAFRFFQSPKHAEHLAENIHQNIDSFASSLLCDKVILFMDYKGSDYRKTLYPEYKGNRKRSTNEKTAKLMEEFFKKLPIIEKILNIHYPIIKHIGVEADDCIFYVAQLLDKKCVILSTDADLLQVGVPQFSFTKKRYITLKDQGFNSVKSFIDAKCLAGDNSDNVKGLERIGLKTVAKYFNKYEVETYDELLEKIPSNTKSKIEQRFLKGRLIFNRNKKLMDLQVAQDEVLNERLRKEIHDALKNYKIDFSI